MMLSKRKILASCTIVAALLIALSMAYFDVFKPKPRLSIITSIWNGDTFIEGFLEDITKQTIFPKAELILINANSPGNEEPVIRKYLEKYSNIVYVKLEQDPGLYGVWNRAIKMASSEYVANANLDDRSEYNAYEKHVEALDADPSLDLVYSGYLITEHPNETFENNHYRWVVEPIEFSRQNMQVCLPGPRPVWRKSMHEKYGYFDETFSMAADWGMWLRATSLGAKFKKIPGCPTLYYLNPKGLSTDADAARSHQRHLEEQLIVARYHHVWES
jgi:glycosyltransferase involved in cell wall biosynthesis